MGILPSKLPFSRKHHVSSRTQVGACPRVRQAGRKFNLFSDYSSIAHRSETHRKASKGRLNCSEGRGHEFESRRAHHLPKRKKKSFAPWVAATGITAPCHPLQIPSPFRARCRFPRPFLWMKRL